MIPGIAGNPYLGPYTPKHLFRRGADGWILLPRDHSTLWIDEERTEQATLPGDPVWWIGDKSSNQNHFGATSSAARGRLLRWPVSAALAGAPRNQLTNTEALDLWITSSGETSVTAGETDPLGGNTAFRVVGVEGQGRLVQSSSRITLNANGTLKIFAKSLSGTPRFRFYAAGAITSQIVVTTDWAEYEVPITTSDVNSNLAQIRVDVGSEVAFWRPQFQVIPGGYQRVGAGVYDVTEDGYPDCWGIGFDGVTTQYLSTRGIPLFKGGRMRALMAQTKLAATPAVGTLLTNETASGSDNSVVVFAPVGSQQYRARYKATANTDIDTADAGYASPHSSLVDVGVNSAAGSVSLRINDDSPLSGGSSPGAIIGNNWLIGNRPGVAQRYDGILWGSIMVAEEPDPDMWEIGARQWLSDNAMGGILAI